MKKLQLLSVFIFMLMMTAVKAQKSIDWISIEELEAVVAKDPKPVFIDVYTDWCGWCKRMDKSTFIDPGFVEYVNKNYYAVKLDGEEKKTLSYRGETFKFIDSGRRGYNELAAGFLQNILSYPTYVILDKELTPLQSFKGYRTAKEFLPIIVFLGEEHYKDTKWEEFLASWQTK